MSIPPTPGIAAAWSAAKVTPADRASRPLPDNDKASRPAEAPEPKKGPPPRDGQGTRVDVRV